jgi:hypothetical protein
MAKNHRVINVSIENSYDTYAVQMSQNQSYVMTDFVAATLLYILGNVIVVARGSRMMIAE